jgi:hypothetical protein
MIAKVKNSIKIQGRQAGRQADRQTDRQTTKKGHGNQIIISR